MIAGIQKHLFKNTEKSLSVKVAYSLGYAVGINIEDGYPMPYTHPENLELQVKEIQA